MSTGTKILSHLILYPIYILPRFIKRFIAYSLSLLWYYVFPHRKKVIVNNLKLAFPDWDEKAMNKMAFATFYNWAFTAFEYSYFPYVSQKRLNQITEVVNREHIENAFAKGKGVLILGTHTGNGELSIYRLCMDKYPLYLIGRKVKNVFINDVLFSIRERSGLKHLDPKNSSLRVVRALKNNEGILFVLDQFTYPPIGIKSTFFGHTTGTNSSLAYFALKFKVPVVPAYSYRKDGKIIVSFDKEIETEEPYEDLEKNVSYMTQKYNDWIEKIVRQHPESWMWIHKRWKKHF